MKECDNSTRKIHISSNFILSISLLIMVWCLMKPRDNFKPFLPIWVSHWTFSVTYVRYVWRCIRWLDFHLCAIDCCWN